MTTYTPTSIILYVKDVEASTEFYRRALGKDADLRVEDFAVFALSDEMVIGLQARSGIDPAPAGAPGSVELSMSHASREDVDSLYSAWRRLGFRMALEPTELDFGYTFVATDPDGHRLRVCATATSGLS